MHPGKLRPTPVNRPRRSATMAFRATRYGFTSWSGKTGELDHRIPFFLGGETNVSNLWPETGPIPNRKDALECYVRDRICVKATMRVRTAVRSFSPTGSRTAAATGSERRACAPVGMRPTPP